MSFTGATPSGSDPSHADRQLDLEAYGFDDVPPFALDLRVSDCGTGRVSVQNVTAVKCEAASAPQN